MSSIKILFAGIVFIIAGIFFCGIAFYMGLPESREKIAIYKPAGFIFYIIGAITFILGLFILIMKNTMTKSVFQLIALIYLVFITIVFTIFTIMIKEKK